MSTTLRDSASARIVIVGGGVASVRAALTLRADGFSGALTMVSAEAHLPYDRPPLSKQLLREGADDSSAWLQPAAWFSEQGITLLRGVAATQLDTAERTLHLSDGSTLPWDALLVATGASPRTLPLPAEHVANVLTLRTLDDARALRAALTPGARVLLIGFGYIGAEVGSVAIERGCHVTALEVQPLPFPLLGAEAAQRLAVWHRTQGIDLRTATSVQDMVVAHTPDGARLTQVTLTDGTTLPIDLVLVSIGVDPALDWLRGSGLQVARGVLVDAAGQTSVEGVWAAGDVAAWPHPITGAPFVLEHVEHAGEHAAHVARSMLGIASAYAPVPFFASEQGALLLQLVGFPEVADTRQVRLTDDPASWSVAMFRAGQLCAVLGVNRFSEVSAGRRLMRSGAAISIDEVAATPDLRTLVRR